MNGYYPLDVIDAGVRAYDRWAADTFGPATDRLLLSGGVGTVSDIAATIAELKWIAERGFVGTYAPGFVAYPHLPPLYDGFWEPVWAAYADLGLTLVVHGGYGFEAGTTHEAISSMPTGQGRGGLRRRRGRRPHERALQRRRLLPRSPMPASDVAVDARWGLRPTPILETDDDGSQSRLGAGNSPPTRCTLREHRAELPAKRSPSEYWQSNCLVGLSFMHKGEVDICHEIGVDTIDFGRDYPHTEGTWPNTFDYWKIIFAGAAPGDVRKILGENAIRFFDLDRNKLEGIASRIGPDVATITAPDSPVDQALVDHLAQRCGVLKPNEGEQLQGRLEPMIGDDLIGLGVRG